MAHGKFKYVVSSFEFCLRQGKRLFVHRYCCDTHVRTWIPIQSITRRRPLRYEDYPRIGVWFGIILIAEFSVWWEGWGESRGRPLRPYSLKCLFTASVVVLLFIWSLNHCMLVWLIDYSGSLCQEFGDWKVSFCWVVDPDASIVPPTSIIDKNSYLFGQLDSLSILFMPFTLG